LRSVVVIVVATSPPGAVMDISVLCLSVWCPHA